MSEKRTINSPLPRQLVGRMAAVLTSVGAVVSLLAEAVDGEIASSTTRSVGISVLVGVLLWFAPWERWGSVGTLSFFVLSIVALIVGDAASTGDEHPEWVPVFLMSLFAWNGLAHRRWTSIKLAPLAVLAYFAPASLGQGSPPGAFGIAFTVPFAVLVGEVIAWISEKLTTAENERLLSNQRADFLRAAQHELRTPLTSLSGYAQMLRDRGDQLSPEVRKESADAIARAAGRMNVLLTRMSELERGKTDGQMDLSELGLLAAHYGEGEIDLKDPLRGADADAEPD